MIRLPKLSQIYCSRCIYWGLLISVFTASAHACGPTPQKVVEHIHIALPAAQVLAALTSATQRAALLPPDLQVSQLNDHLRQTRFGNGWTLIEQVRLPENRLLQAEAEQPTMQPQPVSEQSQLIEDTQMQSGSFPVSQYRGVLKLQALSAQDSVLIWSARFNNQANLLDAPSGQDNAAAVSAVSQYYREMLGAIKHGLEHAQTIKPDTTPPETHTDAVQMPLFQPSFIQTSSGVQP